MMADFISYNNLFIDPESLIEKSEIVNNKLINGTSQLYENDDIIEIDSDSDSDTENTRNLFQSEFEKVVNKSELTLEVLKEVPHHEDKENITSRTSNGKGRQCPKENKPKKLKLGKIKKEKPKSSQLSTATEPSKAPEPSTAPKTFNISLGFLGCRNKSRDKSKISSNKVKSDININECKNDKQSGKSRRLLPDKKSITNENNSNTKASNLSITKNICDNFNNEIPSSDIEISINKKEPEQNATQSNEITNNSTLPVKRKRGRPFGTFKVKDKKLPKQKGRPLSNGIIEIPPKKRRGRPFLSQATNKNKYDKPGRPSLGRIKIKKYDKRGRPPGPPKPIKLPGKRGRKPNPNLPKKKPKIPGRGRGRPSFAALKALKENKKKIKAESVIEENNRTKNEAEHNITVESGENEMIVDDNVVKNESNIKDGLLKHKNVKKCNFVDNKLPVLKEKIDIENNDAEIETISEENYSIRNETESETEHNITVESDENETMIDDNVEHKNTKKTNFVNNNLTVLKGKHHIENNDAEIETISLSSSDSDSEILNEENTNYDDGNDYFTLIDNNFSKVEVHLEYMIREKKAILQKRYI